MLYIFKVQLVVLFFFPPTGWPRERCVTLGCGCHRQRFVGSLGTHRTQAFMETPGGHGPWNSRLNNWLQIYVNKWFVVVPFCVAIWNHCYIEQYLASFSLKSRLHLHVQSFTTFIFSEWRFVLHGLQILVLHYFFGSEDALTREEALQILREMETGKNSREERMINRGYPAYVTSAGVWDDLGFSLVV